jgi:uroporphyrin-III C-methyltransferase
VTKAKGAVYLVGAGPGAADLITVRASRLVRDCDVLIYDYLVDEALLEWTSGECERICVGKRAGFHSVEQSEIERLMIERARAGKQVVRLKGGDPFIFGRGGEEAAALRAAGIPCVVVPAVTAALGCAASSGIPLTHREHSSAVTFLSGHEQPDKASDGVDWASHAQSGATLVLYMAMGRLGAICSALIEGGRAPQTPAAVIQWGATPQEQILRSQLSELAAAVEAAGMGAPAIVIIGEVAGLGGFEARPSEESGQKETGGD